MKHSLRLAGFCLSSLFLLLVATNPQQLTPVVLILPFVLVFMTLLFVLLAFAAVKDIPKARAIRFAAFTAALPTLLFVLQSLGQLTFRDVLTIIVLFCIAYFYMTRIAGKSHA